MRRTKTAVASEEGFGVGKPLEAMGVLREEVDGMLMVQIILDASLFCGKCFAKTFGTDIVCCSDTSSWTLFESMISVWK